MRRIPSRLSGYFASALVAAASSACAQSCLWSYHAGPAGSPNLAVYHSGLQRVLVLATSVNSAPLRMWAWDGTQWTLVSEGGPPKRYAAAVTYDSARDRVVLFGGYWSSTYFSDTWEWDGATWTQRQVSGPSGRWGPSMIYDAARQETVLFGGQAGSAIYGDTWVLDGQGWTLVSTTGPTARSEARFAYDSVRGRGVLYGGYVQLNHFADLWEWDGAAWNQQTGTMPGVQGRWLVFDASRQRMVLGREVAVGGPYETWELDAANGQWTLRDAASPAGSVCAFDQARARAVFTGTEYNGAGALTSPGILSQSMTGGPFTGGLVSLHVQAVGSPPLSFQWFRDGQPLANAGHISGVTTDTLTLNPTSIADNGPYWVTITNLCTTTTSNWFSVSLRRSCYPNCDESTGTPVLTPNDFMCFMNAYVNNESYADCDQGGMPALTGNDFVCFMYFYAQGCP